MSEVDISARSFKDFFTREILQIALLPLIITLVVLYVLFFTAADMGLDAIQAHIEYSKIENGEKTTEEFTYVGSSIVDFLLQYTVTSWVVSFLVYTVGSILVAIFSVFIALIVIGFLTPTILNIIRKRHYPDLEFKGYGDLYSTIWATIKYIFIAMLIFFALIPFFFIPILNFLIFNLPLYYLFHKLLTFDVASTIMSRDEEYFIRKDNKYSYRFRTLSFYFISMIPFISLFSTVFYVVYLGHAYLNDLNNLRGREESLLTK